MYLKQIILDFQCPNCKSDVKTTTNVDSKIERDGEPLTVITTCPICCVKIGLQIHYHREND